MYVYVRARREGTRRQLRVALVAAVVAAALFGLAAPALAVSPDGLLGLGLQAVVKGKAKPAITISPRVDVKKLEVVLTREDGKITKLKAGKLRAGQTKVLTFAQPQGVFGYQAQFEVVWGDGDTTSFGTRFEATRVGELRLSIGAGDVDMDARHLVFQITNPAQSAELVILGERGRRLGVFTTEYERQRPGTELELQWGEVEGEILRMDLKVTDIAGFWVGMQITPFYIEIPHEEVVFESGRHEVRASEAHKLEGTMGHIQEALEKHGTLLQLKLFVAGYTDTVGNRAYNQDLSNRRARAIAGWFRKRGLKVPIYYAGFGEDVLAKETPDETDEQANRRAVYVLSGQSPGGPSFPGAHWKKL